MTELEAETLGDHTPALAGLALHEDRVKGRLLAEALVALHQLFDRSLDPETGVEALRGEEAPVDPDEDRGKEWSRTGDANTDRSSHSNLLWAGL